MAETNTTESRYWAACRAVASGVLLMSVGWFLWLSRRGFEYTDESFYLLSILWWRDITSSFSLFGVLLGWLFDVVGQDVAVFRMTGVFLLLCASAYLALMATRSAVKNQALASRHAGLIVLIAACSAMQYYAVFTSLRVPSYNLLALCLMLVATGVMLNMLRLRPGTKAFFGCAVVYGFALGICAAAKVSTALVVALIHIGYVCLVAPVPRLLSISRAVVGALLGLALAAGLVLAVHPDAIAALSQGLSMSRTVDARYGPLSLVNVLRWDVQRQIGDGWFVVVGLIALAAGLRQMAARFAALGHQVVLGAILLAYAAALGVRAWAHLWLLLAVLCWLWSCSGRWIQRDRAASLPMSPGGVGPLSIMLISLPLAFSFGTNGRVLEHSAAAAAPATLGVCLLVANSVIRCAGRPRRVSRPPCF
jgi:hypothetical protein